MIIDISERLSAEQAAEFQNTMVFGEALDCQTTTRVFSIVAPMQWDYARPEELKSDDGRFALLQTVPEWAWHHFATVTVDEAHNSVELIYTEPSLRRKGLASMVLDLAREVTGLTLTSQQKHCQFSDDGRAFAKAVGIRVPKTADRCRDANRRGMVLARQVTGGRLDALKCCAPGDDSLEWKVLKVEAA